MNSPADNASAAGLAAASSSVATGAAGAGAAGAAAGAADSSSSPADNAAIAASAAASSAAVSVASVASSAADSSSAVAVASSSSSSSGGGAHPQARNPGPGWGYRFLRAADRVLPECVFKPLRALGTLVAMALMPAERRHSRAYLSLVLGRRPARREVFRHFFAFEEALMDRLRLLNGRPYRHVYAAGPDTDDICRWMLEGGPMMLGTFHVGVSDMQGFQLAASRRRGEPVFIVRRRVGNSHDVDALAGKYGRNLRLIWTNDPAGLLFALKEAAARPGAIAMQCDRVEPGARTAAFRFLGARRLFPVTIYHLALLFQRPVILSAGMPGGPSLAVLHASPRFEPVAGEPRAAALSRARAHFQAFLEKLETLLRADPWQWFNFIPLNPVAPETGASAAAGAASAAAGAASAAAAPAPAPAAAAPAASAPAPASASAAETSAPASPPAARGGRG